MHTHPVAGPVREPFESQADDVAGCANALARTNVNAQRSMILTGHSDMETHTRYVREAVAAEYPRPRCRSCDAVGRVGLHSMIFLMMIS